MNVDPLKSELDQVTAELTAAKTQYASLGAKIAGLEARRAALSRAVPGEEERSSLGSVDIAAKYRTDDIVEILTATGTEMSINDVVAALHASGRPHETYDNVGADLAYLAEAKRITRVRRGFYAAVREPQAEPGRIVITLTQGNINNNHVYLSGHLDFFPEDAIGATNKHRGQGRMLELHFEGLSGAALTDIASDKKIFRLRDRRWREFFNRHGLQAGDKIAIEKRSNYEYHVVPLRSGQAGAA